MVKILSFDNEVFGKLRIADCEGAPWFLAKDVAVALVITFKFHNPLIIDYFPALVIKKGDYGRL